MSAPHKHAEAQVSLILGSASDAQALLPCRRALDDFGIRYELQVLSAHRTPDELAQYAKSLASRSVKLVIAAAGMAAHLPGVVAAHTHLPVLGVPLAAGALAGVDALLSIAQMPGGVPVACLGIGETGGKNAAYLAARILALHDNTIRKRLEEVLASDKKRVLEAKV